MEFRTIEPGEFDRAMNIAWYADKNEYYEAKDLFGLFPRQFVGSCDGPEMNGFCFGWPVYIPRDRKTVFLLRTISTVEGLRGKGIGSALLKHWEQRVWEEFDLPVGLGSTADPFYLKNGYTFLEHCIKTDLRHYEAVSSEIQKHVSRVEYAGFPTVAVLVKNQGRYDRGLYEELVRLLRSEDHLTFFEKPRA